ncbi:glycosyltransferase family 28 [Niallia circulans]|uniref:Glycosyltransferase family 28 n=1 Tax=Niallia circulans TaxID=1397 RepID=A0A553SIK7_NIACI|nr:PssE/Cps14G family polysaccharide biosynthesis glycosyltransferase [Niallia circulans]TRZ36827.1 glycosyltransferase family 28 [Niallia circulans]
MIFVTVGTQKFQFNRLFKELDKLKEEYEIKEEIIAQIGVSDYVPANYNYVKFVDGDTINRYMETCSLLITHSGTSSIIQGLRLNKKVLVVPRLAEFGEHVDNHQVEIAKTFEDAGYVEVVNDISNLGDKLQILEEKEYEEFSSDNTELLSSVREFIGIF